jgi:uncharacterized protein YcbX
LLTSEASRADLGASGAPVPMDRFRPNFVVAGDGLDPWAEDAWESVTVGGVELRMALACSRCVITTVDQRTGEKGPEPLATLTRVRRTDEGAMFGVYLAPEKPMPPGTRIAVGDAVLPRTRRR